MSDEIYIFGSTTRGEVSPTSDIDVLVVTESGRREEYPIGWSVYSKETITSYFRSGRLFAWHLYLDAVRIFPRTGVSFLECLGSPASYQSAREDIAELESILEQSLHELHAETSSLVFELGVAYTALRDIAMSASWRLLGQPSFSVYAPYELPERPRLKVDAYRGMMLARHSSARGTPYPHNIEAIRYQLLASSLLNWTRAIRSAV